MEFRDERGNFTEDFKRWAVAEFEAGRKSLKEYSESYGIQGHSTILKWCRRYGKNEYPVIKKANLGGLPRLRNDQELLLQNQVKMLERELKETRLKQATLETLIDIAERDYSINIKKNTGGRQSTR
jgi:transposase-like protein